MNSDPTTLAPINTSNLFPRAQTTPLTQMIDEISFSISSLDTDIAQIQATLAGLRKSRQELITRLKALKAASALNPVYRLPVEILLTIFGICVDEDIKPDREMASGSQFDGFPPLSLNTTKAPWVLGQVCRRWRDVALSTPDLWKVVDVNWNGPRGRKGRSHTFIANLLSLRLQRAENQPLSVSLNRLSCRRRIPPLLFSKCSQWVNLTVYIPSDFELHLGFKSYCGMLHNLSTLHLHLEMQLHDDWLFGVHNAPNLRTLTLSGNYDFFLSLQTQIPWNQITHFTTKDLQFYDYIDPPPTTVYLDILPLLANVQECSLEIPHRPDWGQWRPPLTLAHLRNLTFTKPLRLVALSDHLILPALRRLRFDNVRTYGVRDTIIRFSATLEELIFDGIDMRVQDFVRLLNLGCLRNLRTLKILQCIPIKNPKIIPSAKILQALSIPNDPASRDRVCLPNLRHLTLGCKPRTKEWPESDVVGMVRSRIEIDDHDHSPGRFARLESFIIVGFSIEDPVCRAVLKDLCIKGLVFSR